MNVLQRPAPVRIGKGEVFDFDQSTAYLKQKQTPQSVAYRNEFKNKQNQAKKKENPNIPQPGPGRRPEPAVPVIAAAFHGVVHPLRPVDAAKQDLPQKRPHILLFDPGFAGARAENTRDTSRTLPQQNRDIAVSQRKLHHKDLRDFEPHKLIGKSAKEASWTSKEARPSRKGRF
jgi:hypothetical protein